MGRAAVFISHTSLGRPSWVKPLLDNLPAATRRPSLKILFDRGANITPSTRMARVTSSFHAQSVVVAARWALLVYHPRRLWQPEVQRLRGNWTSKSVRQLFFRAIGYCGAFPWTFGTFCRLAETEFEPCRTSGAGELDRCSLVRVSSLAPWSAASFAACSATWVDWASVASDWVVSFRDWVLIMPETSSNLRIIASWVSAIC